MVDGLTRDSRKQFVFMSLNIFRFLLQKVAEAAAVIVAAKAVAANIAHSTGTSIVGECCCTTNQIRPVSHSIMLAALSQQQQQRQHQQ